ncbi:murein L,D-transpeptidase catalytic domain family protein [Parasalinivibrio latis]|uniref:murein L,D-transpeptidase catalytic domain family protein n=1 Tax=Parasalinivibrio latis TaxID=2952610 RepID=UPI0030DEAC47
MKKIVFAFTVFLSALFSIQVFAGSVNDTSNLYKKLHLSGKMNYHVFSQAYNHFKQSKSSNGVFTIIDYSQPSSKKRFWIIDSRKKKVLLSSYVSHGKNSGQLYARHFSNVVDSHQTSLGVFRTGETYIGKHGYSLRLDGLSKGKNDNARRRAIVIHGADYANPGVIKKAGQLGRSWGCPALPTYLAKKAIDMIKNGTYIYAYS